MGSYFLREGVSDRFDNSVVGTATAKIHAHTLAQLVVSKSDLVRRQILSHRARHAALDLTRHADCRTNLTRRAVTTLKAIAFDKGPLQRVHLFLGADAFD